MIDTHCHLLPDVDDGPKTLTESVALGRALAEAGVHTVVCTPHYSRRWRTSSRLATDRLHALATGLDDAQIELRIAVAAECSSAAAVDTPVPELHKRQLGPGYVLVELEPDTPAGVVGVVTRRFASAGLRPVFAHPERCRAVRAQPRLLDSARAAGGLVQVVASSLASRHGNQTERAAWSLLEGGRADLLASDAHRARHAGGHLKRTLEAVGERIGEAKLEQLVETRPAEVVGLTGGRR